MSFWEDDSTDQIDLLEAEKARRLDILVRHWFIFAALDYANNGLADVAFTNYSTALQHYKSLFSNQLTEHLYERIEAAKVDYYYHEFAKAALGVSAKNPEEKNK